MPLLYFMSLQLLLVIIWELRILIWEVGSAFILAESEKDLGHFEVGVKVAIKWMVDNYLIEFAKINQDLFLERLNIWCLFLLYPVLTPSHVNSYSSYWRISIIHTFRFFKPFLCDCVRVANKLSKYNRN